MYAASGADGAGAAGGESPTDAPGAGSADDDVVDAEVIDDEK
jgi:molecular chaperone DnaK